MTNANEMNRDQQICTEKEECVEKINYELGLVCKKEKDDDITGKKDIETLFRESEKRRLLALESTSDGIWEWYVQTGQIITSPSYFTMLGCNPSELDMSYPEFVTSYDEFLTLLHFDDRDHVDKCMREHIDGKKSMCEIELRLRTKSGGWKWIMKRGKVVEWDEHGNPVRMIGTHIDIHESKLAKDALKQSEERIRAQYMGTPIPTYTWQKVGNDIILIDYNTAAVKFTNGKISEFIGKKAHMLYKDNKEIYENIIKAYHDKAIYKFETLYNMFTLKDKRYVDFTCAYVAPDMVLVHMEDITKQKLAEKKLKESEERIRGQYMGTPIPTYTWQKAGNDIVLVEYNLAAYEFTNGKISEFIGKKAHVLYKDNKEIYDSIIKTYLDKTTYKGKTIYHMTTLKDTRYIALTCAYVAPDMVLVHMEDITKQKLAEKKLQCSEKDLRELTAQLFKAEENVNKYIAQELHDSIGQYLSSIKYIAEETINQIQTGHLEKGSHALETIISIIQTTIDEVSRISMGLRPSTLDDLGILATISWFCREYHRVYPNIDLEKKIEIEENDVPFTIKTPLFRILQESLNNVARHSQATKVQVDLVKTGSRVEMSITDNGIGFNVQEKITSCEDDRKGFGLVSMQERTKYSGGVFSIESAREKGTIIRASWPCK